MKKTFVIILALFLAMPAVGLAGTATSRWDLNIGGVIDFDIGYADQNSNSNGNGALREPRRDRTSPDASVGNFFMQGSDGFLTFVIKGPDVWGAKTSAFLLTPFHGIDANANNHTIVLGNAKVDIDWPTFGISFGVQPTLSGLLPTMGGTSNSLSSGATNQFNGGLPGANQVILTKIFAKDWKLRVAAVQVGTPPGGGASATSANDNWTRAGHPGINGILLYNSDKCGKVGPWRLTAKLGGMWARERRTFNVADNPATPANEAQNNDDFVQSWLTEFQVLVPIIPEKNTGNKAGALFVDGNVWTGQNMGILKPSSVKTGIGNFVWTGSYKRPDVDGEFAAPVTTGWSAHAAYYLTDKLWFNGFYGYTRAFQSHDLNRRLPNSVVSNQRYIANIMYDVNPALRVGLEWNNIHTRYARETATLDNKGTLNTIRTGAWYYF